jgi:hypothetical protein
MQRSRPGARGVANCTPDTRPTPLTLTERTASTRTSTPGETRLVSFWKQTFAIEMIRPRSTSLEATLRSGGVSTEAVFAGRSAAQGPASSTNERTGRRLTPSAGSLSGEGTAGRSVTPRGASTTRSSPSLATPGARTETVPRNRSTSVSAPFSATRNTVPCTATRAPCEVTTTRSFSGRGTTYARTAPCSRSIASRSSSRSTRTVVPGSSTSVANPARSTVSSASAGAESRVTSGRAAGLATSADEAALVKDADESFAGVAGVGCSARNARSAAAASATTDVPTDTSNGSRVTPRRPAPGTDPWARRSASRRAKRPASIFWASTGGTSIARISLEIRAKSAGGSEVRSRCSS